MKKNVWIMNHYATDQLFNEGGRHYWFAKYLKRAGYEPVVFGCNVKHNGGGNYFQENPLWQVKQAPDGFPFVVIRSTPYAGNGLIRVRNMAVFAWNLIRTARQYAQRHGRPEVILASSVHPLTILAGEWIARRMKVPCIAEVRDLWPESIFAYYPEQRTKAYSRLLYAGEKYLYKKADAVVMTWEGGLQYVKDMGWEKEVPESKVFHISNGVDLDGFHENRDNYPFRDADLDNSKLFKVIYTGAIRKVNLVEMLADAAEIIESSGNPHNVRILIWGNGDHVDVLNERIRKKSLVSLAYKGSVNKQYIPSILSKGDCCILQYRSTVLDKFGQSQNKYFEYLAAGKPVLMTYSVGYSISKRYDCGIELDEQTPEAIAKAIQDIVVMSRERKEQIAKNAITAARDYDFKVLSDKLIDIIESIPSDET